MKRRRYVSALSSASLASIAGCQGDGSNQRDVQTTTRTTSTTPKEKIVAATELDDVPGMLEEDGTTLDFRPANNQQPDSILYDEFNGELPVALNLNQAREQRYVDNEAGNHPVVQQFVSIVGKQDTETAQKYHEKYMQAAGGENLLGFQTEVDWEMYMDETLDLQQRLEESGINDLWYKIELEEMEGISSTHNELKAQALHNAEQINGFNTFIWDYGIPSHGMVSAIQKPTNQTEKTSQQETYVIQTDPGREHQITTWNQSPYSKGQGAEPHPAHPEFTGDKDWVTGVYGKTALPKNPTNELDHDDYEEIPQSIVQEFNEFFRKPRIMPAREILDPLVAAAYIDEENPQGNAIPSTDAITFQV
jgi:hypothetical protein